MKKKALALAVAGALVSPAAFAAQDTSGMQYTSAAEGFYASVRARYNSSGGTTGDDASIGNSGSRFGVRGTNDLGGGLSGFYQLEWGTSINSGDTAVETRVGHVGLSGAFGSIRLGSGWNHMYNNVYSSTDIASASGGNFYGAPLWPGRSSNAVQYDSPDLNGFKVGAHMVLGEKTDTNDVDSWGVSGVYNVAGFSVGASYSLATDGLVTPAWSDSVGGNNNDDETPLAEEIDDASAYALKAGYSQDNWYVNAWYGTNNTGDINRVGYEDDEVFSIAGGVEVDKVNVYFLHENKEYSFNSYSGSGALPGADAAANTASGDETFSSFGVIYRMGSNTRVWIEYAARDIDDNSAHDDATTEDDYVSIGLRHDF